MPFFSAFEAIDPGQKLCFLGWRLSHLVRSARLPASFLLTEHAGDAGIHIAEEKYLLRLTRVSLLLLPTARCLAPIKAEHGIMSALRAPKQVIRDRPSHSIDVKG